MCVCVCMSGICVHVSAGMYRVQKRELNPGGGVTGDCELSVMGVGNPTHVLWETSKCS